MEMVRREREREAGALGAHRLLDERRAPNSSLESL